jgi:hypothetical protein
MRIPSSMSNQSPTSVAKLRVDQVGSVLRPQKLKDVYARHGNGEAGDEELRRIQDESIEELIARQEMHGLSILSVKISPLRVEMTIAAEAPIPLRLLRIHLSAISNPSGIAQGNLREGSCGTSPIFDRRVQIDSR